MADVSLYNQRGIPSTYSVGRGLRLFTEDGTAQDFFPGNAEDLTVTPDFQNGDMVLEPSKDAMFEKVTIRKPANLIPENIAEGTEIAGVIGTFSGGEGSVQLEGDILKHSVYSIDTENEEITMFGIQWNKISYNSGYAVYDLTIPDKCGQFQVVIDARGLT